MPTEVEVVYEVEATAHVTQPDGDTRILRVRQRIDRASYLDAEFRELIEAEAEAEVARAVAWEVEACPGLRVEARTIAWYYVQNYARQFISSRITGGV